MDLDALFAEDLARLQQPLIYPGPTQPVRVEFGIPFYTSQQISIFGLPHLFGVDQYQIIELQEDSHPPVTDYDMEQERRGSLRPIHHYSRVERFEQILYQLVGCRGVVPRVIVLHIQSVGFDQHPDRVWDSVRAILKKNNWSQYYNRIPIILDQLGFERKIDFGDNNAFVLNLVNEFRKISCRFEELKPQLVRSYFPNLRYVAFKLLQEHGAVFQYKIPFLRTPRKEKMMDELWELLRS
jgi:hypothetical protein